MNTVNLDLRRLGRQLEDRLGESNVEVALDYINHNEIGLALTILLDQVIESDAQISDYEYSEFSALAGKLGISIDDKDLAYLRSLVGDS